MEFLHGRRPEYDLTFNDVFLVPSRSDVRSRFDVSLKSTGLVPTTIPIIAANMTSVTGPVMAETLARRGGIAILPQDLPIDLARHAIDLVKSADPRWETPVVLTPSTTVGDALIELATRAHGAALVVDQGEAVGVLSAEAAASAEPTAAIASLCSTDVLRFDTDLDPRTAFDQLTDHGSELAAVVDPSGTLVGALSRAAALRSTVYEPAIDHQGRLIIGAALGINGDPASHCQALLEAGADVIVVDTAHGHQVRVMDALSAAAACRDAFAAAHGRRIPLVAGNVVTADAVRELASAGADILKVGVGPGAMCTTRMMTGVGRPQFSAVLECAEAARAVGAEVWADGGVRHPRDVALALAAGASHVMIGSWFAGTHESPGPVLTDESGRAYKESFGMASARAVAERNRDAEAYQRARLALFEEGISNSRIYLDRDRPGVEGIVDQIVAGVRSSATYAGARSLSEFAQRAIVGVQSSAGYDEGRPLPTGW